MIHLQVTCVKILLGANGITYVNIVLRQASDDTAGKMLGWYGLDRRSLGDVSWPLTVDRTVLIVS